MKILHIIAGANHGGAETFCKDAIKALNDENIDQLVITRPHENFTKELCLKKIPSHLITFNRFHKFKQKQIIKKTIENYRPDIVHCWMNRAASFMPNNVDIPTVGWFGGYYHLKNYKNCDYYMGVTKDIVRHIVNKTKKPHRVFLNHTFGTLEKTPLVKKSDFNIPDNAKVILLLSRMHNKKGVDTLLCAAQKIQDVYFLLAGDGPNLKQYQELANKLGVAHKVRFLGWRNDRASLLNIADICVLPSRYEPFGTVIAEAWASNVPLVCTKAAGALQYVTDEKNGLLCEIDDATGLAKAFKRIIDDKELKDKLVENGSKAYQLLFSKNVVVEQLIASYQSILENKKPKTEYFDDDFGRLPEEIEKRLSAVLYNIFNIPPENHLHSKIIKCAAANLCIYHDTSMAYDAAFLQAVEYIQIIKSSIFGNKVSRLGEVEINQALENYKITENDFLYNKYINEVTKI